MIDKPFHRLFRPMKSGENSGYSGWNYIVDKEYAQSPEHYIRAYHMIQSDLIRLFEFVEPADKNLPTFSLRIHELFVRTCIEIESNFKAILRENLFPALDRHGKVRPEKDWNIYDYMKVRESHHLGSYIVYLPIWKGHQASISPFATWKTKNDLDWYSDHNKCKHDRHNNFELANFSNLLQSVAGLQVLLAAQFQDHDFSPGSTAMVFQGGEYFDGEATIGEYFRIKYPEDFADSEHYQFDWGKLKTEAVRFQKYDYS